MKPSEILRKHGWRQWTSDGEEYSVYEALYEAAESELKPSGNSTHRINLMIAKIWDRLPDGSTVAAWIGTEGRTQEEVIAKLEEAGL